MPASSPSLRRKPAARGTPNASRRGKPKLNINPNKPSAHNLKLRARLCVIDWEHQSRLDHQTLIDTEFFKLGHLERHLSAGQLRSLLDWHAQNPGYIMRHPAPALHIMAWYFVPFTRLRNAMRGHSCYFNRTESVYYNQEPIPIPDDF